MKKKILGIVIFILLVAAVVICLVRFKAGRTAPMQFPFQKSYRIDNTPGRGVNTRDGKKHLKLTLRNSGVDIFNPLSSMSFDYSYGSTMLLNDDGSVDAWFSSPADGVQEFDWITWRHADGIDSEWTGERVVLSSTPGSLDSLSVCDPDVFYHEGYYYMGYTSTIDATFAGLCNSVFLARSKAPEGPYEKWNGSGWGGDPAPILYYDGFGIGWGCGEPAFVKMDDQIFLYTTKDAYSMTGERVKATEVRCGLLSDEMWPAKLDYMGIAAIRTDNMELLEERALGQTSGSQGADGTVSGQAAGDDGYLYSDCDSWDVVYCEEYGKFLAVCTNRRFTEDSCLLYYESDDGICFERVSEVNRNLICGCHNVGVLSDGSGHVKKDAPFYACYGYGGSGTASWGFWATRFAPLKLEESDELDRSEENLENIKLELPYCRDSKGKTPLMLCADKTMNYGKVGQRGFSLNYYWLDADHARHYLDEGMVQLFDYDSSVADFRDGRMCPVGAGRTTVSIEYGDLRREIALCTLGESVSQDGKEAQEPRFFSETEEYSVPLTPIFAVVIRPVIRQADHTLKEMNSTDPSFSGISFESEDEEICRVGSDGVLFPVSAGQTRVRVSSQDGGEYTVTVKVISP